MNALRPTIIGTASLLAALLLSNCQQGERIAGPLALEIDAQDPVRVLQQVNSAALNCWVKSGWRDFRPYRLVPELDTRAGKPRILIVKSGDPRGLPQMVIEADGQPVRISTYGPLATSPLSARINDDVIAFSSGRTSCT